MTDGFYKIDLHTHSIISHDGGISKKQYAQILSNGALDCIAITDHNEIGFAKTLNKELGPKIIIGEEIKTLDGEIIGLFLNKLIPAGQSVKDTVNQIKSDGGLVYIPHPFENFRDGLQEEELNSIIKDVDIIEVFNGRGVLRGKTQKAYDLAVNNKIAMSASSDAHCKMGIGFTYSLLNKQPTKESLVKLLNEGSVQKTYAPLISLLCPSVNKVKNKLFLGI